MKSICLITLLMQIIVQMPDKDVSAINFTITGFDVTEATCSASDKVFMWNRINDKESQFIIYGGKRKLTNDDKIMLSGYQTAREIKLVDVIGANDESLNVPIYNRYKRG